MRFSILGLAILAICVLPARTLPAQPLSTGVPLQNLNQSFYEQSAVQWSVQGPNFFANFGGPPQLPAFGNADPNAGLRTGFGFQGGGLSGSLGLNLAQGSSRSSVSTAASVTTLDGQPGSISSQVIRPFVTGVTPIVSGYSYGQPARDNVSTQMFQSHGQAQASYLQTRRQANFEVRQRRAAEALDRAKKAESEGNLKMARANYRRALAADQGMLRNQILVLMRRHGW